MHPFNHFRLLSQMIQVSAGNSILRYSASEALLLFDVEGLSVLFFLFEEVPLVEFMYLAFTRMPGESYRRWLRSLLLYFCYIFRTLINSLVCWFFLLCFSVLYFSNILQIPESLVTFSVKSVDWIIKCLGKLIQISSEIRVFSMNLSKQTTSPKLLFVLLSQCGDLCLKIIYWCLVCFSLTSMPFPFSGERYGLFVTYDCKKDLWTQTVQFERIYSYFVLLKCVCQWLFRIT